LNPRTTQLLLYKKRVAKEEDSLRFRRILALPKSCVVSKDRATSSPTTFTGPHHPGSPVRGSPPEEAAFPMNKVVCCLFAFLLSSAAHAQTNPKVVFVGAGFTYNWQQTPQFTANKNWIGAGIPTPYSITDPGHPGRRSKLPARCCQSTSSVCSYLDRRVGYRHHSRRRPAGCGLAYDGQLRHCYGRNGSKG
jgi:hypothetical protein